MKKNVLIIGGGSIASKHAVTISAYNPSDSITVLSEHSFEPSRFPPGVRRVRSLDAARDSNPDLIVIANPASEHLESLFNFKHLNVPFLIEKPITSSLEKFACESTEAWLSSIRGVMGYNIRFCEAFGELRERITCGFIGQVFRMDVEVGQYLPDWRPGRDYRSSVSGLKCRGGGVLNELSHELDYVMAILGRPSFVSGWMGKLGSLQIDVEDTAFLHMGFRASVVANFKLDFIRRDKIRRCTVFGDKGTLHWDLLSGKMTQFHPEKDCWDTIFCKENDFANSYARQWMDVRTWLESAEMPAPDLCASLDEGIQIVKVIDEFKRSFLEGDSAHLL